MDKLDKTHHQSPIPAQTQQQLQPQSEKEKQINQQPTTTTTATSIPRNFRSSYYEKLGFCGNEEKNILDLLIAACPLKKGSSITNHDGTVTTGDVDDDDDPDDNGEDVENKLNSFLCEQDNSIDRRCIETWKILLGVECDRKNPFDEFANVEKVRTEHFQSLKHNLEVLLRHKIVIKERKKSSNSTVDAKNTYLDMANSSKSSKTNPPSPVGNNVLEYIETNPGMQITLMYLLEAGQLDSSDIDARLESTYCRKMSAIALFFVNVSRDIQEAFFLFRNFTRKLEKNETFENNKLHQVNVNKSC